MNDSLTELRCSCGAALLKEDVDFERGIASCSVCQKVMTLEPRGPPRRAQVPQPKLFRVAENGDLSFSFRRLENLFGLAFMGLWLIPFSESGHISFLFLAIPALVVGQSLVNLLNHTRVFVRDGALRVHHLPFPWPLPVRVRVADIDQLFSVDVSTQGKGGLSRGFAVKALLKDGSERVLVTGLREHTQALFLEQLLERRLDLRDRAVPGELPRE